MISLDSTANDSADSQRKVDCLSVYEFWLDNLKHLETQVNGLLAGQVVACTFLLKEIVFEQKKIEAFTSPSLIVLGTVGLLYLFAMICARLNQQRMNLAYQLMRIEYELGLPRLGLGYFSRRGNLGLWAKFSYAVTAVAPKLVVLFYLVVWFALAIRSNDRGERGVAGVLIGLMVVEIALSMFTIFRLLRKRFLDDRELMVIFRIETEMAVDYGSPDPLLGTSPAALPATTEAN